MAPAQPGEPGGRPLSAHGSGGAAPSGRASPFLCPYCGDEDLRPDEAPGATWCPSCDRRFTLRFLGMGRTPIPDPGAPAADGG